MDTKYDRITQRRSELGLSEADLIRQAGLSVKYLQALKRDPDKALRSDSVEKLAQALRASPGWILYGDESNLDNQSMLSPQIDPELLAVAHLLADKLIVARKIVLAREDRYQLVATLYEIEYRRLHNLPEIESPDTIDRIISEALSKL